MRTEIILELSGGTVMTDTIIKESSERTYTLGIIYEEEGGRGLTHPFFSLILNEFKIEAEAHGYDIMFLSLNQNEGEENYIEHCRKKHLDGVCIVCAEFESPKIREFAESGIPCVTVDHMYKKIPAVMSDNETGMQKLVEYAVNSGHKKIAFVSGQNNSVVTKTRITQFCNVMKYYKLPIPEGYIREGKYDDVRLTRRIVAELLKLPERPTCILLPDDICYFGAREAAHDLELRVPADISFMGYDGIPLLQSMSPKLTTIRQSTDLIGKTAAQRLISLIENPKTANRIPSVYPIELISGGTVENIAENG